jgi:hypothetical protein
MLCCSTIFSQISADIVGAWKLIDSKRFEKGVEVKSDKYKQTIYFLSDGFFRLQKKPNKLDDKWVRNDTIISFFWANNPKLKVKQKIIIKKLTDTELILKWSDAYVDEFTTYKRQ